MIIWTTAILGGVLIAAGVALYLVWANSSWLADRRHSLSKLDSLVEEFASFDDRFSEIGGSLNLPEVCEAWAQQRSRLVLQSSFIEWLRAGSPRETIADRDSSALFQFARSQAGPLVWSMSQSVINPDSALVSRIEAVIDADSFELRLARQSVQRVTPARRLSDA